jgi:hypothetical protein
MPPLAPSRAELARRNTEQPLVPTRLAPALNWVRGSGIRRGRKVALLIAVAPPYAYEIEQIGSQHTLSICRGRGIEAISSWLVEKHAQARAERHAAGLPEY